MQVELTYSFTRTEAEQQESQGTRYQFGAKAERHYSNAVVAFRCASSLNPTSFDALYNAARVTQQLGSEHLAAPECYTALEQAVAGYRQALPLAQGEEEGIDAMFNLAQACVELQEMSDGGATEKREEGGYTEARRLFAEVERLQTAAMEKVFGGGTGSAGAEEEEQGMEEVGEDAGMQMGQATEGRIVTPQLVLDTILEGFEVDLSLYSSSSAPEAQATHALSAGSSLSRAFALRQLHLPPASPSVDLSLSLAQLSLSSTCSPHLPSTTPHLLSPAAQSALYTHLLTRHPRNPSLLSTYADHLIDSLSLPATSPSPLDTATEAYLTASTLLSSRLTPPKDLPAHAIPSLLSANLVARSTVALLRWHLLPPDSGEKAAVLKEAQQLAMDAVNRSGSGLTISRDPSSSSGFSAKFAPTPTGRNDWTTIRATREAWFQLVRVQLRLDAGQGKGLVEAWGKAMGRSGRVDGVWCVEEVFREDKVWEVSRGEEEGAWRELLDD